MKNKWLFLICILTAGSCLASCSENDKLDAAIGQDTGYIKWGIDESGKSDVSEPFDYNIQIPELTIDTKTAEIINADIEAIFIQPATAYLEKPYFQYDIITKTNISQDILSIKIERKISPIYGIDVFAYAVNYNIKDDTVLTVPYMLKQRNIDYNSFKEELYRKVMTDLDTFCEYFDIPYFFIDKDGTVSVIAYVLEHPAGADTWLCTYFYNLDTQKLMRLSN